ncbi:hypothetical protein AHAS_Ahas20G0219300 [Arachis hypogaea]
MGHVPDTLSCLQDIQVLNLAHNKLSGEFSMNVGFDVSLNCIPGRDMQRPQPECSVIPGGSLSCLRIPTPKPLVCGSLAVSTSKHTNYTSSSP